MLRTTQRSILALLFTFVSLAIGAQAQVVGTASLLAPAVNSYNNTGSLTTISLTVTKGTGHVSITGPINVSSDTYQSAINAATTAAMYLNVSYASYNYTYNIADYNQTVSGPSAGAAMTLLAISAISGQSFVHSFTITGTINNGAIGAVGGVYDKTMAAKENHLRFILVPAVSQSSEEAELYYLTQGTFGIPMIQVANISAAASYAFGTKSINNAGTNFSFSTNYNAGSLPVATLQCSNSCSSQPFAALDNFTINLTQSQISRVPGFQSAASQMINVLNQSGTMVARGYLYSGADIAFLDYINAFYLSSGSVTVDSGLQALKTISSYCSGLNAPQLTTQNYEWVLAGQLRQAWGTYSVSGAISEYNTSGYTTDDVLASMYSAAESNAWCRAANFMYTSAANTGGIQVYQSQALASIARGRLERAAPYAGSMYFNTANSSYAQGNYALAILGSDYAYSEGIAVRQEQNMSTSQLVNSSRAVASNSTYGAWPTQIANQAYFYSYESVMASNATIARSYAIQAYSAALLSQQLSNDTQTIYSNLQQNQPQSTGVPVSVLQSAHFDALHIAIYLTLVLVIVVFMIDVVILILLSGMVFGKKRLIKRRIRW